MSKNLRLWGHFPSLEWGSDSPILCKDLERPLCLNVGGNLETFSQKHLPLNHIAVNLTSFRFVLGMDFQMDFQMNFQMISEILRISAIELYLTFFR